MLELFVRDKMTFAVEFFGLFLDIETYFFSSFDRKIKILHMITAISKYLLGVGGWKFVGDMPQQKKGVIIAAPHTSNWDFIWAKLAFLSLKIPTTILMKKEMFFFPLGNILRGLGVMPVNRSKSSNLVEQLCVEFKKRETLYITLSPEGSRSKREHWKRGFYYIAMGAGVPIYIGIINYQDKTMRIGAEFVPTGDVEADMKIIKNFYRNSKPKFPDRFAIE